MPDKLLERKQRSGARAFAYAAFYGIYGPLFAVMVLILAHLVPGIGKRTEALDLLLSLLASVSIGIWMFLFALVIGMLPAAATGLVYWWFSGHPFVARLPSLARAAGMSLVGGTACVLFFMSFGAAPSDVLSKESLQLFVFPGMVAATLCTILVDRRTRRLSPDNSLERAREG